MNYKLTTYSKKIIADTITPVSVYLKVRDKFPNSILLESSDYHANDNSFSYICFNPIASIKVQNNSIDSIQIFFIFLVFTPKSPKGDFQKLDSCDKIPL